MGRPKGRKEQPVSEALMNLRREIAILKKLKHPHVVRLFEVCLYVQMYVRTNACKSVYMYVFVFAFAYVCFPYGSILGV